MVNFELRHKAVEGEVLYNNKLTSPEHVKNYFPPIPGENTNEYKNRPKISVPLTRNIIERIINFTLKGANVPSELRDALRQSLITGGCVSLLKLSEDNKIVIENWGQQWYTIYDNSTITIDYELEEDEDELCPLLDEKEYNEDEATHIIVDDTIYDNAQHNLPFSPFSIIRNIDSCRTLGYRMPFPERFRGLVVEYNQILSKISKDIKVLSNVWVTNTQFQNPDNPLRLDSGVINYLPVDGKLEQVIRNLDLKEEHIYLSTLTKNIAEASQVPSHVIGMEDVGKIPSGVALQLLFNPLVDLVGAFRVEFVKYYRDIAPKYNYLTQFTGEEKLPEDIIFSNDIVPDDKSQTLQVLTFAQQNNLLSTEDITTKLKQLLES